MYFRGNIYSKKPFSQHMLLYDKFGVFFYFYNMSYKFNAFLNIILTEYRLILFVKIKSQNIRLAAVTNTVNIKIFTLNLILSQVTASACNYIIIS